MQSTDDSTQYTQTFWLHASYPFTFLFPFNIQIVMNHEHEVQHFAVRLRTHTHPQITIYTPSTLSVPVVIVVHFAILCKLLIKYIYDSLFRCHSLNRQNELKRRKKREMEKQRIENFRRHLDRHTNEIQNTLDSWRFSHITLVNVNCVHAMSLDR